VRPLADIERRLGELTGNSVPNSVPGTGISVPGTEFGTEFPGETAAAAASELLAIGEEVLEHWVVARGLEPTHGTREGFRLLALHRQGCTDDPTFNACRETCRELVYHYNLVTLDPQHAAVAQRGRMMTLVANHLFLFVAGKMQVAALGDFCCASRPLRQEATQPDPV
jgi:hypothetical protein